MEYRPLDRWLSLFPESLIDKALLEVQEKDLINLLTYTKNKNGDKLMRLAGQMYRKIGYSNK